MEAGKEAFAVRGRNWKAGKEWKRTISKKNLWKFYKARYAHVVQKQYNFNYYSKMLKSSISFFF